MKIEFKGLVYEVISEEPCFMNQFDDRATVVFEITRPGMKSRAWAHEDHCSQVDSQVEATTVDEHGQLAFA